MAEHVRIERDGRVVVAALDNPPHGLITARMIAELGDLVHEVDADPGVGAVVLTGAHEEVFLAHYDVAELLAAAKQSPSVTARQAGAAIRTVGALARVPRSAGVLKRTPAAGILELRGFHQTLLAMQRSGVAYIAAINGSTAGGGCELSLACDLRLMADGPFLIGQPEILLGFPPGGGGTQRLGRLIGRARALELMLEGRPIEPEEAERIGLVNRLVPPPELLDESRRTAARLATRSKPAVGAIKRAVLEGGSLPLEDGLRVEQAEFMSTLAGEPAIRLMEAYVARLEKTGVVPAHDPKAREELLEGRFAEIPRD